MSHSDNDGFAKFVPGFDFLQNLAKGATQAVPQMPNLSNWIAPSLNEEELDKRIAELKAVHFWLDQNSKALGATVQALEVQKLTLATLKGMNLSMGEVANAFKFKATDAAQEQVSKVPEKVQEKPQAEVEKPAEPASKPATAAAGLVDPMQLWTALTQQFQHIAAGAMKDVNKAPAKDAPAAAPKPASKKVASKKAPAKTARKVAAKSSARSR
ncbi:MAG: hypothetical protein Q8M05_12420 [Rhodoferax sp.]|uniref:PhaM family polyhydroxyalkanoate granule multifunctional regulatory protein n=1 Tax=Rhodoferax sp. TaxID=50421 RepID=UPI002731E410|nr:PhaM family polyhydroxyalkanoate granule multifunctional regulatory protein [Rhodoferax sp.]MDP1530179.1 hypothetical protein [Rhodoferax sp.]MDP1945419.1 hypothetical protein [Rhodoferax sp.]MDP3191182.1 hypothetical protein [Rhodoferax sp.]MDP3337270.1 hypothetical protein [Rhodoferax sp.]